MRDFVHGNSSLEKVTRFADCSDNDISHKRIVGHVIGSKRDSPLGKASSESSSCGIEITLEGTSKSASIKTIESFKTKSTSKIWDLVEGNSSCKKLPVCPIEAAVMFLAENRWPPNWKEQRSSVKEGFWWL